MQATSSLQSEGQLYNLTQNKQASVFSCSQARKHHLSELHPVNEVDTKGQFFRASVGRNPRFQIQLDKRPLSPFPAPPPLSPFSPPDLDRRVDSPALSACGAANPGTTTAEAHGLQSPCSAATEAGALRLGSSPRPPQLEKDPKIHF